MFRILKFSYRIYFLSQVISLLLTWSGRHSASRVVLDSAADDRSYVVRKADSLSKIADKVGGGLTVVEIINANHLRSDRLAIGQRLVLPVGVSTTKATSPSPEINSTEAVATKTKAQMLVAGLYAAFVFMVTRRLACRTVVTSNRRDVAALDSLGLAPGVSAITKKRRFFNVGRPATA